MNKKIKELAEQAELPCQDRSTGELDADGNIITIKAWDTVDPRVLKFAELIIKECAELVSCNAHVSGFSLGDLIKEHFGINDQDTRTDKEKALNFLQGAGILDGNGELTEPYKNQCSVCGTTENVRWVGGSIPYLCESDGCIPF